MELATLNKSSKQTRNQNREW